MAQVSHVVPTVYTASTWLGTFSLVEHLYCNALTRSVSPSIGSANLQYEFGRIRRTYRGTHTGADGLAALTDDTKAWTVNELVGGIVVNQTDGSTAVITANTADTVTAALSGGDEDHWDGDDVYRLIAPFADIPPLDILREFVRVDYAPNAGDDQSWWGVVVDEDKTSQGADQVAAGEEQGTQTFVVAQLAWLLQRVQIDKSYIDDGAGGVFSIDRSIPFNEAAMTSGTTPNNERFKNRSNAVGADGVYVFADDPKTASHWSAKDIVEYLVEYFPISSGGIEMVLDTATDDKLDWYYPQNVKTQGRTLYDVFNQIIDRRRGLTWFVEPDTDTLNDDLTIYVESFNESPITLPSADTLTANTTQVEINFETDGAYRRVAKKVATSKQYEQIKVIGSRLGSCFSVSVADGTLEAAWTSAQETAYKTGASGFSGYASADQETKIRMNDTLRKGEALRHVYTSFRIPEDWDGLVGDGEGNDITEKALPNNAGDASQPFWYAGLRFENRLPIRRQYDYSTDARYPTDNSPDDSQTDYAYPMVHLAAPSPWADQWFPASNMSAAAESESLGTNGYSIACRVRMHDHQLGLDVIPSGLPHSLSGGDFAPSNLTAGSDEVSNKAGNEADWEFFIATVYVRYDAFVEVVWPAAADAAQNDQQAVLVINLGDRCRLDYLAKNTVLGVDEGNELIKVATAGYVRDDRELMEDVARTAYIYHGVPRTSLSLSFHRIDDTHAIGNLVTKIGAPTFQEDVNTIITRITHDFVGNSSTWQTDFAELDPTIGIPPLVTTKPAPAAPFLGHIRARPAPAPTTPFGGR